MKKQFKAESKKLLDMMINSIYTNKDIFLRELISNASDAIDKLYYKSLTDKTIKIDKKELKIRIEKDKEKRIIKIIDNGCGMTEEQMSKIFEPYYTTKSSGTGLGLTVLFKIMKQHDGDVTVRSTKGVGSEFTLQIPIPSSERFRLTDDGGSRQ